ncbi:MAG TPA: neuraminidase-like domain-containing protein [Candidatus Polarisedimenticolia bacterium]|nr:neuraminidase-like domain-containing protein [Candidatus Polarisedimenticolia bacterium]
MSRSRTEFQVPLYPESQGKDVAQAQTILMELGLSIGSRELREQRFGSTTAGAVARWKERHRLPPTADLDVKALKKLWADSRNLPRFVHGVVSLADGTPVPDLCVVAIDRDFRGEQVLGEGRTDAQGRYRIGYRAADAVLAEKRTADVGVRVLTADGKTLLRAPTSRDLAMNAGVEARIHATVTLPDDAVPSEFARIGNELAPLVGRVPVSDIGANPASDEGDFLARESGVTFDRLGHFVVAHRLEQETKLPAEYFYALLREDGLFGIGPGRPRAVLTPVDLGTSTRAVLYEAVLLEPDASKTALQRAVRRHLVQSSLLKQSSAIHKRLQHWRKDALAYVQQEMPRRVLDMLDDLLADGKAQELLSVLGPHDLADLPGLFERLDVRDLFSPAKKRAATARMQLADLLGLNTGLIEEVAQSFDADTPDKVRKLARLERKDWSKLLDRGNARMKGKPLDPKLVRRQASLIVRRFEKRFPTTAFSAQLARRKPKAVSSPEKVVAFFDAHPDFELSRHKLQPFLKSAGVESRNVGTEVIAEVEKLQRIFRLTGDYRKTEGLVTAGYKASADIVAAGKSRFVTEARRSAGMSAADAAKVFETAANQNLAAVMFATNLRTQTLPPALQSKSSQALSKKIESIVAEQPDLKSLFGSTDVCACKHCRSIYGPAAYFADGMRFLRNRLVRNTTLPPGPSTKTAKDVLFARRPDLGEIDLNCENAEVPVPHIDIVCELMEEEVAPDPGFSFTGAVAAGKASAGILAATRAAGYEVGDNALIYGPYDANRFMLRDKGITVAVDGPAPNWKLRRLRQTHGTPEERAASPEYVNTAAYAPLAAGKAAFGLPFDLFHAETRAFLSAAGVERAQLMRALAAGGSPSPDLIAGEALGLAASERILIFSASVADQPAIWGVAGPVAANSMRMLDVFISRTGLSFAEVESLLEGAWVRSGADLFIRHLDNTCNLSAKEIVNLDDTVLDRIHRELRLSRRSGLSSRDVDRLASAPRLGGSDLGSDALQVLPELQRLAAELKVEVGRLITWLDRIPTDGAPSEHALLFQNSAATGALDPGLTPAAIAANEAAEIAVPGSGQRLSTVASDLALAFGVTALDLQLLLDHLGVTGLLGINPPLTSLTLAAIYGRLGLARALGLRVADYLGMERLCAIDPLANVFNLSKLVDSARRVAATGVTVAELEYRLSRRAADLAALDLAEVAITPVLQGIRTALVAAAEANRTSYDDGLTAFEQIGAFESLLQKQPLLEPAGIAALSDLIRTDTPTAAMGMAAKAVIDGPLSTRVDVAAIKAAIDAVVASPGDDVPRKALLKSLMQGLCNSARQEAAFLAAGGALTAMLRVSGEMGDVLLRGVNLVIATVPTPLVGLLTDGVLADGSVGLSPAGTPDLYRALRLAYSVAGLIAPFDPGPETVDFMLKNAAALGWSALDGMPFEGPSPAPAASSVALADWLSLADAFALIKRYPATSVPGQPDQTVSAMSVFTLSLGMGPAKGPLLDALSLLSGWPRPPLGDIDGQLAWVLADYRRPSTWRSTENAIGLMHQLGVPLTELLAYCSDNLTAADSRNARRLLRSRYSQADWLGALKGIMDPIRERKRDALVAYLLAANPALHGKADLYDHFLTDTEWSAKMPSSRLVHAHSTLQLFIRRCIEGLEPTAVADLDGDSDWGCWESMKNFRVAEVAKKVFVEAEYYLRPPWRDDKTEAFVDFENALLQNEMNDENISAAFEGYLDRLEQIAFLDVLATCYDFDSQNLHVFAATKGGDPRTYFHRTLQAELAWTPWRKIDLDITGEHLIAFFRNKRLYLAWAIFLEKGDDQQQATYPQPGSGEQDLPKSKRFTEISLAVSEYTGKKWLPRRVSADPITTTKMEQSVDTKRVVLTVSPDPEYFTIDVHFEWSSNLYRIGSFLLTGCKGYPEMRPASQGIFSFSPKFQDTERRAQRLVEHDEVNDHSLAWETVFTGAKYETLFGKTFGQTPAIFRVTYPFQASEIDKLITTLLIGMQNPHSDLTPLVFGTFMPFFFEDNRHGYVLTPGFYGAMNPETGARDTVKTFSNIRQLLVDFIALVTKYLQLLASAQTDLEKQAVLDQFGADKELARIHQEFDTYKGTQPGIVVRNFYHPNACYLRERFFQGGIPALLARKTQLEVGSFTFEDPVTGYAPSPVVLPPYPREEMEFDRGSAYADVNFELAFHAPHMITTKLMDEDDVPDFDAAEKWLRYMFDSRGSSNDPSPQRYWNTKPFYLRDPAEYTLQSVNAIMDRLAHDPNGTVETELAASVLEWRRSPFKPYLVARSQTIKFQQAIVFLAAKLHIGRANAYFRRDQLEDLVMAALDYSQAERLLGPRPQIVPPAVEVPPETYNQLEARLDLFGNALCRLENLLPDLSVLPHGGAELPPLPLSLESLYFCIPPSEKLYELWDELEERQFNLRNSRTIDGVERELSLFAPPLSVEALIQAVASGLSISAILSNLSAPRPPYRFRVMVRHSLELAELAASLSQKLEQAIIAGDGEGLQRLRTEHEKQLLKEQTEALKQERLAAAQAIESARKARQMHEETQLFYAGRPYMNAWEIAAAACFGTSVGLQALMVVGHVAAAGLAAVPKFMVGAAGFGGSPTANAQIGGDQLSEAASQAMVGAVNAAAQALDKSGSMLNQQGTYLIRQEDWENSSRVALREKERLDIEMKIGEIRKKIAEEQERVHGVRQLQNAAELMYHQAKFSKRELFDSLAGDLRGLSRQIHNLANESALATQRCYNFDMGTSESFVRAGQWNDTRRGLLAAENLIADLRRMDAAYLRRNVREMELTTHISLARLDPIALLELRTSGRCVVQLPEAIFDLDHPGHYFRRIKALSITVPCVAGPYSSVPLKLTQTSNRIRVETGRKVGAANDVEAYSEDPAGDTRFRYNVGAVQSIAFSRCQDDPGLHLMSFDDDRYLPLEGSGVIGTYVLEFPRTVRPIDYSTIPDVVFHFRLKALDGGGALRTLAESTLRERLNVLALKTGRTGLFQAFDLRRDRPDFWSRLTSSGSATLELSAEDLPYFTSGHAAAISATRLIARVDGAPQNYSLTVGGSSLTLNPPSEPDLSGLLAASVNGVALATPLTLSTPLPSKLRELIVIVNYALTV